MFTLYRPAYYDNPRASSFVGLSTDEKPLDEKNGASFEEIDTGKVFRFDEENKVWHEEVKTSASESFIANEFSASSTYAVGDYVIYEGKLYQCTTAVTTAGSWNSSNWTQAVLGNDVAVLGNDVSDLKSAFTFQTSKAIDVSQGYWAIADGTATDSTTWCRSGFVNFDAVILSNAVKMYLLAYNINGSYVGAWNGTTFSTTYNYNSYLQEISIYDWLKKYPAYRFKIDYYKSNSTLTPSDVLSDIVVKNRNNTRIDDINLQIDDINLQIVNNCKDVEFWESGYWAIADGTVSFGTTWARSNQIIDDTVIAIESTTDAYKLFLLAYEGTTYIGTWFGNGFSKTYDTTYISKYIDISYFRNKYPNYIFKLDITKIRTGAVDLSDIANTIILKKSKVEQNSKTIQTVYGDIAKSEFWENGTINLQGNKVFDSNALYRVSTCNYLKFLVPVTIVAKDGYVFSVTTYLLNKEKELQFSTWCSTAFTFNRTDKLYKISIKATEASVVLNPENVSNYIESYVLRSTPFDRILAEYANVKAIGHRGFNTVAPENTLPAFEMSAAYGFKYVETDILFTQDGVPVLMHDATINRTCCNAADGSAITEYTLISSLDYDELDAYDACTPSQWATWKGTKIPTFAEFMFCCKANNLNVWIELKAFGHTYTQAEIQLIISIIKQYGMEEHVSFISFSYDALVLVKNEWDTVELGLNGTVANAQALKTGKNRVFMIFDQNGSDYSDALAAGFQVCFYTVNTTEQILALPTNGFDSVLTNVLFPSQVCDTVRAKYDSVK